MTPTFWYLSQAAWFLGASIPALLISRKLLRETQRDWTDVMYWAAALGSALYALYVLYVTIDTRSVRQVTGQLGFSSGRSRPPSSVPQAASGGRNTVVVAVLRVEGQEFEVDATALDNDESLACATLRDSRLWGGWVLYRAKPYACEP
jgi:hypothetical protein